LCEHRARSTQRRKGKTKPRQQEFSPEAQRTRSPSENFSIAVVAPEELIWQKAYIMERERFDGADVAHLLAACAPALDWERLVRRFGPDWRVLWGHLILFGFIFPSKRNLIPLELVKEFSAKVSREQTEPAPVDPVCNGTLLSRIQYQSDLRDFLDARLTGRSSISTEELRHWVKAGSELARRHRP
jgi:hypothetical protein